MDKVQAPNGHRRSPADLLLGKIKAKLLELEALLVNVNDHWCYEDMVYRFYHHSFKVYSVQATTQEIVETLKSFAEPGESLNPDFLEIVEAGTAGKKFRPEHNDSWTANTRVFLEAFFHAKFFLEMTVKYGKELKEAPRLLPSGWAAVLYLFNIR